MTWGWNPETVGALATAAATLFAAVAALLAVMDLRRRHRAERRSQALLVAAWGTLEAREDDWEYPYAAYLHIRNGSDLPVINLWINADSFAEKQIRQRWHGVAPGEHKVEALGRVTGHDSLADAVAIHEMSWQDNAGRLWMRDKDGQLHEVRVRRLARLWREHSWRVGHLRRRLTRSA